MHDRLAQYRVNAKLKNVRSVLGRTLMALDKGPEVDFSADCTIDNWRTRLSCKMLWRYITLIKLTEQSRRATRS